MLAQSGLEYKRRCCLRQVVGEKKSLQALLTMAQHGLELLNMPSKKLAEEKYLAIATKPIHYSYIERDILSLNW